jgi:hypothetical protein
MSLKNLKLAVASPVLAVDPTRRGRNKLLGYLAEQQKLLAAEAEGQTYTTTRIVRRKSETGEVVTAEAPRHVRRGWFTGADGKLYFHLRYGSRPLDLGKGTNAVAVPSLEELPSILATLVAAVNAGELDEAIATAAAQRRANFKRKDAQPAR